MTRKRRTVGDVVKIPLANGRLAFGYVLEEPLVAFFDYLCDEVPKDLQQIVSQPVAFKIWVMNRAIVGGMWPVLGNESSTAALREKPWFFKQDSISKKFTRTQGGELEIPATTDECQNLERAAVWSPEHVLERLQDHFAGRSNKWVESMKA